MNQKKIVFVFPGQGSQKQGMLKALSEENAQVRATLEEASDVLGYDMKALCFDDPEGQLGLTEFTQPALLATSTAVWRALQKGGAEFTSNPLVAGHSLGEYSALVALGVLDFADALRLVRLRGRAMQEAVPLGTGGMSAIVGEGVGAAAERLCSEISEPGSMIEVANENSPGQLVVSGHLSALGRFALRAKDEKAGRVIPLSVSAPFHSSLMQPAAERMSLALKEVQFHQGSGQILANVDAKLYSSSSYLKDLLVEQVVKRVRWTSTNHHFLLDASERGAEIVLIEVGSGAVLQGLLKKTLGQSGFPVLAPEKVHLFGTDSLDALASAIQALSR